MKLGVEGGFSLLVFYVNTIEVSTFSFNLRNVEKQIK